MNPLPFILLAISLPLLLGGCGEKEVNGEVKPVEVPLNSNLKYEIKGDAVTITGCDKQASEPDHRFLLLSFNSLVIV